VLLLIQKQKSMQMVLKKLYDAYLLDKKKINLYYAASTYVNANDYDVALKLYDDLKP
jgi:hypothetical protein